MDDREQLAIDMQGVAEYFRQRVDGASKDSQNRYWHMAEIADRAAAMIRSDGETIREYEEWAEGMEDDGR